MNSFASAVRDVAKKYTMLMMSDRYKITSLPRRMPSAGVYVFSRNGKVLYVGRTNALRRRLQYHTRNNHNQATFAFLLARHATGKKKASYKKADSRNDLLLQRKFRAVFDAARESIRGMDVQFIEEHNPNRQALLEICAAIRSKAKYNDFDNH